MNGLKEVGFSLAVRAFDDVDPRGWLDAKRRDVTKILNVDRIEQHSDSHGHEDEDRGFSFGFVEFANYRGFQRICELDGDVVAFEHF